jgi:hypothetical protein
MQIKMKIKNEIHYIVNFMDLMKGEHFLLERGFRVRLEIMEIL